jgi:glutathione synthase/RimK-type ligase-like ATP-grasp enzyme
MKRIKSGLVKVFFSLCKTLLPKKYYDALYIGDFIRSKKLEGMKPGKKIWCFVHGFLPYEYVWYDLPDNDYRGYVPARSNYQKRLINGSFNAVLGNKLLFEKHIKSIIQGIDKLHVVESIGYIEDGYLKTFHKAINYNKFSSLIPFLEKNDLILKPVLGDGGVGVLIVRKEDDHYLYNNNKVSWNELVDSLKNLNNYLIQEKFLQSGFSSEIYSGSLNTMRIATMIDPDTHNTFIAYAAHRFGSSESGFMDNINQGGLAALIDLKDGRLSEGRNFSVSGEKNTYKLHPVSSNTIYNMQIPDWINLTKKLIEMARRMPYLKYVGWDIILSNDELYILEGNVSPGLGLIQTFKPMSDFPAAWKFFKHYKYVG